jgi:hypothetical protein
VAFSLPINITAENLYPPVQLRFDLMKVSVVLAIFTKRARYLYNEVKNVENQNTKGLLKKKKNISTKLPHDCNKTIHRQFPLLNNILFCITSVKLCCSIVVAILN